MSNSITLKKSSVPAKIPQTTDLTYGEIALNYADGKLYYKSANNVIDYFDSATSTATLTNKSLTSPTLSGTISIGSTTLLSIGGSTGSSGQYLSRTPTGLAWSAAPTPSLSSLTDVTVSSPTPNQVLTWSGAAWVNAASNAVIASAVFASSQYDLGYVNDTNVTVTEDEGSITSVAATIYDLGVLSFTGIISLNNIDQSVKSDYLGYSIIFGF